MGKFNCLESRQTKLFEANQIPVKNKIKFKKIYSIKTTLTSLGSTVKAVVPLPPAWGFPAMPWLLSQSPFVSRYWQTPEGCLRGLHASV